METGSGTVVAALLAVGAAFAWGGSTAFSRSALLNISNTLATGLRFYLTIPLSLLADIILRNTSGLTVLQADKVIRLIVIALSTGMVALWICYKGLRFTQVKVATFLEHAFPLTGVAIDVVYYHNVLHWTQYLAAAVLLFAMYTISNLNQVKHEQTVLKPCFQG